MKIYDKKLAYPYFVWMTLFTVVPLLIVVYYAFTDPISRILIPLTIPHCSYTHGNHPCLLTENLL